MQQAQQELDAAIEALCTEVQKLRSNPRRRLAELVADCRVSVGKACPHSRELAAEVIRLQTENTLLREENTKLKNMLQTLEDIQRISSTCSDS